MQEEKPKLAPTVFEHDFLEDKLDRERLDGVSEGEIKSREADIVATNVAFDTSLVPQAPEGIDISRIIDSSGKGLETIDSNVQNLGSSAVKQAVEPLDKQPVDSGALPPPSLN